MGAQKAQWNSMLKALPAAATARVLEAAVQADPTSGHVYVSWILGQARDEVISLPRDAPAVRHVLTRWLQVKAAGTFMGDRDINRYGFYGLRAEVERALRMESQRQAEKRIRQEGAETIYDDGTHRILRVTTAAAALLLARGTKWCTREPGNAAQYLKAGCFYLVFVNGRRYAQLHFQCGEIKDEADLDIVPSEELAHILRQVFLPATLADWTGLSLVLGQALLTADQDRELLRWWSDRFDVDDSAETLVQCAARYLDKFRRRGSLVKLAREALSEGRLDIAWKLDAIGLLPMAELRRPLRAAIQRAYAKRDFIRVEDLLRHFQGTNLLEMNLNYLKHRFIEWVWKLFRLEPAASLAIASATLLPQKGRGASAAKFVAFYEDLQRCRQSMSAKGPDKASK